ncbi:aspartyl protease family protein [Asticcacaulis sp. ZE23SCel15]|uniref:aspartyl protease family protein n=1 Tax=Asticcacaulis sp. ZE23SCel15 TaxID=3059027 RepID=UPI0026603E9D|nr:aspartyl protease family protein [Asticcacaulis sp. ZE23SCel15]WKL58093.1 aspartyl protease family protein [Asticcacaulis sp. ZE23SCel15]
MSDINRHHLCRRALIRAGAATCLTGLNPAWGATLSQAADEGSQDAQLAARTTAANQMTVGVFINGQGPYQFVVDTAAEQSVISTELVSLLALTAGRDVMVKGINGLVPASTAHIGKLTLGPFVHRDLTLPVLPRTLLKADGFLGLDVINGTRVTFDFRKRTLRVEAPRYASQRIYAPDITRVKAYGSAGHLRISDCRIDRVLASAIIDTGAEVSIGNTALRDALLSKNGKLSEMGEVTLSGVTGGELIAPTIRVSKLRMQELTFSDAAIAIADVPVFDSWRLQNKPALLVGMDFLRQFAVVSIDYRAQEIRFELADAPPNPRPEVQIEKA